MTTIFLLLSLLIGFEQRENAVPPSSNDPKLSKAAVFFSSIC
jgi:hypothetical protein